MTIYDQSGVEVILTEDSDVVIILEGNPVITMTAAEFEYIAEAFYESI